MQCFKDSHAVTRGWSCLEYLIAYISEVPRELGKIDTETDLAGHGGGESSFLA